MVAWSGETPVESLVETRVVQGMPPSGGIGYANELPADRGEYGVLLNRGRLPARPGERGRPLFSSVHGNRQRRAMRKLLCQSCGGPASMDGRGVLWLLDETVDAREPGWPEGQITAHPPVCVECAGEAVRQCPALGPGKGYTAVRVRLPVLCGFHGRLYTPGPVRPLVAEARTVIGLEDPRLPWLLATQSAVRLEGCTVVRLEEETGHR
ncbi:hypothetical protein [Streptomyces inusitatus]|uniref:hypothetical protein n=1 Tax=Streptomyces inusitatus TaxID=68221 RepID=UPI001E286F6F|nr:hypothetical protein [Streptomyces inusitatus]